MIISANLLYSSFDCNISIVKQVWYHGEWCSSRGRNCNNTKLTDNGGCCIWYNEPQYLGDIEEHLGVTIQQVEKDLKIAVDEFDGKVVYGAKRKDTGSGNTCFLTHVRILTNFLIYRT